ncbi:MAG: hypothetical protein M3Q36_01505 [bacterium]|nr:hypothetical protein [bacterium]
MPGPSNFLEFDPNGPDATPEELHLANYAAAVLANYPSLAKDVSACIEMSDDYLGRLSLIELVASSVEDKVIQSNREVMPEEISAWDSSENARPTIKINDFEDEINYRRRANFALIGSGVTALVLYKLGVVSEVTDYTNDTFRQIGSSFSNFKSRIF